MKWIDKLKRKGVKKHRSTAEMLATDEGSAVRDLLVQAYHEGYNEGYALGVHDTKNKLKEVARRLSNGRQES